MRPARPPRQLLNLTKDDIPNMPLEGKALWRCSFQAQRMTFYFVRIPSLGKGPFPAEKDFLLNVKTLFLTPPRPPTTLTQCGHSSGCAGRGAEPPEELWAPCVCAGLATLHHLVAGGEWQNIALVKVIKGRFTSQSWLGDKI